MKSYDDDRGSRKILPTTGNRIERTKWTGTTGKRQLDSAQINQTFIVLAKIITYLSVVGVRPNGRKLSIS